jgi:hypothetical protein
VGNHGLCHHLDFFSMSGNWSQHGFLTAQRLGGGLPDEALGAIAAHDQIKSDTLVADMLKLADSLAVIEKTNGRDVLRQAGSAIRTRRCATIPRTYLADILRRLARKHDVATAWARNRYHVLVQTGRNDPRVIHFEQSCGFERRLRVAYVARRPIC